MLWACLYFSDLPLRAVFEDGEQALPCAVVDGPRQRPHVVLANAPAQRSGVSTGRVLAAARAVCATLLARTRDRPGEQRLLLSLAAWAYRFGPVVRGPLRARQAGLDPAITEIAWRAQKRLHDRYRTLVAKGKNHNQVITAVGRELLGFIWDIARTVERQVPVAATA
jgi:hypothetical protein